MLLYHYLNRKFGLEDIRKRRLKIARLDNLNDPFDHRAIELRDRETRRAMDNTIRDMAKTHGLICLSKTYQSPVMWSHYADRHRGICLGFEIGVNVPTTDIKYIAKRIRGELAGSLTSHSKKLELIMAAIYSKHSEWRYEKEVRIPIELSPENRNAQHAFEPFSDRIKLRRVIVGYHADISRREVDDALGELKPGVETFKVRPAFGSFKMTRNRDPQLWI